MTQPTIAVAVIAKNEEDRIGRLLDSVRFADEIVVVDSGSTDGTERLCAAAGARVVRHPWAGYAAQKQFALEQTRTDWVLSLDADETVPPPLAAELRQAVVAAPGGVCAFSMPRLSRYLGRWIRHSGWYPDRKVRLVRRGKGFWRGTLHERLHVDGRIEALAHPIHHDVYRGIADHVATVNAFSDIYAAERGPAGGWFAAAGVIHALGKFLECYVWKGGLLDGLPGLVIAMNSAWYVFLKHAKA
ncbi:MAG: glycosyltransferase family 2 protein, partial [Desulfobacterales bacterium]|nr:glycosyltransferase family 2 protein [Desulfobacterales bacterium]